MHFNHCIVGRLKYADGACMDNGDAVLGDVAVDPLRENQMVGYRTYGPHR